MHLGQSLDSGTHALPTLSKINGRIKFLFRHCKQLTLKTKKTLCTALIQPHFDYTNSAWYTNCTKNMKTKFQTAQNKMCRFVFGLNCRAHIGAEQLNCLDWLNVSLRAKQLSLMHAFKIKNDICPVYLKDDFRPVNQSHNHHTRSSLSSFALPKFKGPGYKTFIYTVIKEWNGLPESLRSCDTASSFKHLLKQHLKNLMITQYYSGATYS